MTTGTPNNVRPHWNYFLAIERDLEATSRYVEFCKENLDTYSIEFAHLLLSSASEVDTIAKCICLILDPSTKAENIDQYRKIIKAAEETEPYGPDFGPKGAVTPVAEKYKHRLSDIKIIVPRHNVTCLPWKSWADDKNPDWWTHYNKVKHERNLHFNKATLRNVLNSIAGLLAMNYLYCRLELTKDKLSHRYQYRRNLVTRHLQPSSAFMRFPREFYDDPIAELGSYISSVSSDVARLSGQIDDAD